MYQKVNCYEIGINIEGEWKIVLLDDYFPCTKKTKIPNFVKSNIHECVLCY